MSVAKYNCFVTSYHGDLEINLDCIPFILTGGLLSLPVTMSFLSIVFCFLTAEFTQEHLVYLSGDRQTNCLPSDK